MQLIHLRNQCSTDLIDDAFRPVIADSVEALVRVFGPGLSDLRLQGSVPRGDALVGRSDLDLLALLTAPATPAQRAALAEAAAELSAKWPVVLEVDPDALQLTALTRFQRFALGSDSISVHGMDQLTRPVQTFTAADLALVASPAVERLLPAYRKCVHDLLRNPDPAEVARASRVTGKDMLRGYRSFVILGAGLYATRISDISDQVVIEFPEFATTVNTLFALTQTAAAGPEEIVRVLEDVERELLPLRRAWNLAPAPEAGN